jgi:enoyl-CoA hydratase/carnithine racemase
MAARARLARWVGRGEAMRLTLGFPLSAEEAHRIGLAQWVVPHAKLMARRWKWPRTSRRCHRWREAGEGIAAAGHRHPERRGCIARRSLPLRMLELTEDKAEGHNAWREKRKPTFKGR